MIPKIIHYCWFGDASIPDEYQEYIRGWKELHPAWEIRIWGNKDIPGNNAYLENAIREKKWANLSNLVRFYALDKFGGVYLDTDIKTIKPLDPLLVNDCFLGFETEKDSAGKFWVNNAVMGAMPGHPFIKFCIDAIQEKFDGTEDANQSAPVIVTEVLQHQWGLKCYGLQLLRDIQLYPVEYFYPIKGYESFKVKQKDTQLPTETYTIHTWGRSWYSKEMFVSDIEVLQAYTEDLKKALEQSQAQLSEKQSEIGNLLESKKIWEAGYENFNSIERELGELKKVMEERLQGQVMAFGEQLSKMQIAHEESRKQNAEQFNRLEDLVRILNSSIRDMNLAINKKDELITTLTNDISYYQDRISFFEKSYENQGLYRVIINHMKNNTKKSQRKNG